MNAAEVEADYVAWSKRVRADILKHAPKIFSKPLGGWNSRRKKDVNSNFNPSKAYGGF
jgi:hypothetical protein